MAATFIVEDGSIVVGANAYCSVAEADQYHENHGDPSAWSTLSQAQKEDAIRQATQYMDAIYTWQGYRVSPDQVLDWPRAEVVTSDGFAVESTTVRQEIKDACAYLALASVSTTLLPDQTEEDAIKRRKVVLGPIQKDIEYVGSGDSPGTKFSLADKILAEFLSARSSGNIPLIRG